MFKSNHHITTGIPGVWSLVQWTKSTSNVNWNSRFSFKLHLRSTLGVLRHVLTHTHNPITYLYRHPLLISGISGITALAPWRIYYWLLLRGVKRPRTTHFQHQFALCSIIFYSEILHYCCMRLHSRRTVRELYLPYIIFIPLQYL